MEVTFRFSVRTDLGTVRTNNEDSALASPRLLVLADGMGGHAAGEVASTVATRVFAQLGENGAGDDVDDVPHRLTLAGRSTRSTLHQMSDADPMLESMGTTLLAVVSHGESVTVGHIGDSRVYALRGSSLYQVTTDHTHVQRLVDTGQLTPEKARTHPYRAMLLRSLDDQPGGPDLDVISLEIEPGDRLLLCSDGLSDYLPPEEIGELLALPDRDEAAESLIDAALRFGTRDNVTVVVADVVDDDAADTTSDPEMVGAVLDGIDLSPLATEALHESLPELAALMVRPADDVAAEGAPEGEPGDVASADDAPDTVADDAVTDVAETDADVAETDVGVAETDTVETETREPDPSVPSPEDPAPAVQQRPPVAAHQREPVLPGVLAGCLIAVLAVVIGLLL